MIEVCRVSVAYGEPPVAVLDGIDLTVRPGELVALVGANGSGKSTLGSLLCGMMLPAGGSVCADGHDVMAGDGERRCVRALVGMVRQDPRDQIVSTLVFDEVAFGPRNLGLDEEEVTARVSEALELTGPRGFGERDTARLSGGEQQRLALSGVLAMRPRYLVLDEATCQLDSAARPAFRALFDRLAHEEGLGVVQITHDPLEILSSDRVVVLETGGIAWEGTPHELLLSDSAPAGALPPDDTYVRALRAALRTGFSLSGVTWASMPSALNAWLMGPQGKAVRNAVVRTCALRASASSDDAASLELQGVSFAYGSGADAHPVLNDVSLKLRCGRVLLLAGCSGEGKSTLAMIAAGLLKPQSGSVLFNGGLLCPGDCALAFQEPEGQFFHDTAFDEIAFAPRNVGARESEVAARVEWAAGLVGLSRDLLDRYPFELSGGQARRVALASTLAVGGRVCILDEPSAGLDAEGRAFARNLVRALADDGLAVLVISHDLDEWLGAVDDVALLGGGNIAWSGPTSECAKHAEIFERCGLIAPFAVQLAAAMAAEDNGVPTEHAKAVAACGGEIIAPTATLRAAKGDVTAEASAPNKAQSDYRPCAGGSSHSALSQLDARVKIIGLLAFTACVFLCHVPIALAAWLVVAAVVLRAAGLTVGAAVRSLRPVAIVLVFALCANLVSCDGGASIPLVGPIGVNPVGGLRGLVAVARIAALVACSVAVATSTTPTEVSDAVVRLLRPLGKAGLPVGAFGTVLSIALRFMPLVGEELRRIQTAQRARGVRFDEGSLVRRIRVWGSVLTPLIVGLFRRADRLADAMSARCYAGAGAVQVPRKPLDVPDCVALAVVALVTAATLIASLEGWI